MKQIVIKYETLTKTADACNKMISDGWLIKFMICNESGTVVTFERPLLDTTDIGPR